MHNRCTSLGIKQCGDCYSGFGQCWVDWYDSLFTKLGRDGSREYLMKRILTSRNIGACQWLIKAAEINNITKDIIEKLLILM